MYLSTILKSSIPLKKEIQGKELSQIEHKIKKAFGLSSEEIKDKKFDEIIVLAIDKLRGVKRLMSMKHCKMI